MNMVKLRKYLSRTMRRGSKQSRIDPSNVVRHDDDSKTIKGHLNFPDVHPCNSLSCIACRSHPINFIRVATISTSEPSTP
ncbi:hypothetical protein ACHAXM_004466 [Skeletonema potamos]